MSISCMFNELTVATSKAASSLKSGLSRKIQHGAEGAKNCVIKTEHPERDTHILMLGTIATIGISEHAHTFGACQWSRAFDFAIY